MKAGERLDGIGGFCAYGLIDNTAPARNIDALPLSLSENCVLRHDVVKDQVISFADVEQPKRGVVDELWNEQLARWSLSPLTQRK
jgi:predicted homoserine dehydrogenase-like protein